LFDLSEDRGNFVGAPAFDTIKEAFDPKINSIYILNVLRLPTYYIDQDYHYGPDDFAKTNWSRLEKHLRVHFSFEADQPTVMQRIRIPIQLAGRPTETPDPQFHLALIHMDSTQLRSGASNTGLDIGLGSVATLVSPAPVSLADRLEIARKNPELYAAIPPLPKRLKATNAQS
jgi:hypothetical protein